MGDLSRKSRGQLRKGRRGGAERVARSLIDRSSLEGRLLIRRSMRRAKRETEDGQREGSRKGWGKATNNVGDLE